MTVTLTWTEGVKEYNFEVMEWFTSPQQGGIVGELPSDTTVPLDTSSGGSTSGGIR